VFSTSVIGDISRIFFLGSFYQKKGKCERCYLFLFLMNNALAAIATTVAAAATANIAAVLMSTDDALSSEEDEGEVLGNSEPELSASLYSAPP
jgi:hypothetical protein